MEHHYQIIYESGLSLHKWKLLTAFCEKAIPFSDCASYDIDNETIGISGTTDAERLVLRRMWTSHSSKSLEEFELEGIDDAAIATLMAAAQIGLLKYWKFSCNTDISRAGVELYYRVCDEFLEENARNWWQETSAAQAASDFHTKWKEVESDVTLMAAAAQSLIALSSVRGRYAVTSILEELNEILMTHFDLSTRPLSEDLESVGESGTLEAWRGELFEIVVHGQK
jgi:hypothetical protein